MSLQLWKKKMAIIAAINKGYLLDVSGNPAVLAAALKKPLQGVTVYGASGGVGDATINLFDKANITVVHGYLSYNSDSSSAPGVKYIASSTATDTIYIPCKPNTTYTAYKGAYSSSGNIFRLGSSTHIPDARQYNHGEAGDITDYTSGSVSDEVVTYTTGANDAYLFLSVGGWMLGDTELSDVLMIAEGAYTAETMPGYEAYGYKIPVLVGELNVPGYTQLEYIESTGTQYIDTGVVPTDTTGAKMRASIIDNGENYILGSRGNGVGRWYVLTTEISNDVSYGWGQIYGTGKTPIWEEPIELQLNYNNSREYIYNNEVAVASLNSIDFSRNTYPMYLFTANFAGAPGKHANAKIYFCAITNGNTLIRNFIPAKRNSDGEIGMYDTVTNTFYTNSDTGDFIAGAEIANKTINLYAPQQLTAAADTFATDIASQTATLTAGGVSTDVSALQDWEQDWTLNKGDNTVSIGTTVQPSAVEWQYLSYSRGE